MGGTFAGPHFPEEFNVEVFDINIQKVSDAYKDLPELIDKSGMLLGSLEERDEKSGYILYGEFFNVDNGDIKSSGKLFEYIANKFE